MPIRTLFVDDHLIESTNLTRTFHRAAGHPANPVFGVQSEVERAGLRYRDASGCSPPMACTFDDGVFFDASDGLFKMWYAAGGCRYTALATSRDGLHWERPELDVLPGTNVVLEHPEGAGRDSFSPWIDDADPGAERYKAFLFTTNHASDLEQPSGGYRDESWLLTSPDGVHWERRAQMACDLGDNTLLFHDPVLERWCLSVRGGPHPTGRMREYLAARDFLGLAEKTNEEKLFWAAVDERDRPDPAIGVPAQLYTIAPRRYEGILVGLFTMWYGPDNRVCLAGGFPKLTEIQVGFARDGFTWERPSRDAFIGASRTKGRSDRGYIRAAGGGFVERGDELLFFYSGFSGVAPDGTRHMYAGGSMHVASLRRDGFASMDAGDEPRYLVTVPIDVTGARLMLNASAAAGEIRVGLLDERSRALDGYSAGECTALRADVLRGEVHWRDRRGIEPRGRVRLRFELTNASLFSFWFE